MHVQIKHSLAHLKDLIPTLAGIKYISNNSNQLQSKIKPCRCARECFFVHAFGYTFELTVTSWCILATWLFLAGSS